MRWLHSLTPVTYFSKLPGMSELAGFLRHEIPGQKIVIFYAG